MLSVIVSVRLEGDIKEYDLEVPVDVPSQKLAELIIHNIDPHASTKGALAVRCLKPGSARLLSPDVSLARAGLWDGVLLEISPESAISGPTWAGILLGWDPLRTDEPVKVAPPSITRNPRSTASSPPVAEPQPPPATIPTPTPLDDVEWLPLMDNAKDSQTPDDTNGSDWTQVR
jgi:hypothetical protein